MDSPRGRIVLMKSVLEGDLSIDEAIPFIDRCLGCQACVSACPSGVQYGELLMPFRAHARRQTTLPMFEKIRHNLIISTFPYPGRFRKAVSIGISARPFRRLMPDALREMINFLPARRAPASPLPEFTPAQGERRARVALLAGCVQQALDPEINWATLRVLAINGVDVIIPSSQVCCGAILMHTGDIEQARELAQTNLRSFSLEVDAILTNAAGCGSGLHEYRQLFQGLGQEPQAEAIAKKAVDVSRFLDQLGLIYAPELPQPLRVAYHDACHLAHAQGITDSPRRLLSAITNLSLIEIEESSMCCGSAGTYNLEQPDIAKELGRRKAERILASGAEAVAMGNIGCMLQIRAQLSALGKLLPVFHTIEILDIAFGRQ
jgi:glycolate oxidase iron-sulfur subunit